MDVKRLLGSIKQKVFKFKYAAVVLAIGLVILLLPGKETQSAKTNTEPTPVIQSMQAEQLENILQSIDGAGKVQVMLSMASGEETVYQINSEISSDGDGSETRTETVITTDSQRNETGLITQINPPTYLGAIVVCEGADKAAVKLAVMQAVAKITGLGSDRICVLKMK